MSPLLPAARTVVVLGVILQLAGFAKLLAIAKYFGTGALLDAYYLGLVIPTFLVSVSTGILQTSLVPAYVSAKARTAVKSAHTLGNFALTWSFLLLGVAVALLILTREVVISLLASDASPETRAQLRMAFVPLMFMAPINGVADCGALLLNAEGKFAVAASAPLLNVVVGVVVLMACQDLGVYALIWSLLAGLAVQALVVLITIRTAGISLRPQFILPIAWPRALSAVALPVLLSNVLGNLVPGFIQMISARAGVGAVSAMGYASRLHNSLVQAVVLSVSVVLLPHFARLTAEGRTAELRVTLERVFAATFLFFAGAVAFVAASGPKVVGVLLQRGNFTVADAAQVAHVWLALTAGLLGATWGIFLARLFQARRQPWVIAVLAGVSVFVNVVLALLFLPLWGVVGVAAASSLAYSVIMCVFHLRTGRTLGRVLSTDARMFIGKALLGNFVAYLLATRWGALLEPFGAAAVLALQSLVILTTNLLLARGAPLRLSIRSILEV